MMKVLPLLCVMAGVPAAALGQGAIAGSVRDPSGAPLPGVAVTATSPALIEKARTSVTDDAGQYRIEDLRPGIYAVTFSRGDLSTIRSEGIEVTGSFTATVNMELTVGSVDGNRHGHRGESVGRRPHGEARGDAEERHPQVHSHGSQLQRPARSRARRRHQHERYGHGDRGHAVPHSRRAGGRGATLARRIDGRQSAQRLFANQLCGRRRSTPWK